MIDASSVVNTQYQFGPVILVVLGVMLTGLLGFATWLVKVISAHTTALAVLISETKPYGRDNTKFNNEIIDLKMATSELSQNRKSDREDIDLLLKDREIEITENRRKNNG